MAKNENSSGETVNEAALREIAAALKTLRFGQVAITVHNSRIVQVEKTEKVRFDLPQTYERGSGI